jgi:hypothetical protein
MRICLCKQQAATAKHPQPSTTNDVDEIGHLADFYSAKLKDNEAEFGSDFSCLPLGKRL